MPEPLTFAVHLDGALVTEDMLRGDDLAFLATLLPEGGSARYPTDGPAVELARGLKGEMPDVLVTIVLWQAS